MNIREEIREGVEKGDWRALATEVLDYDHPRREEEVEANGVKAHLVAEHGTSRDRIWEAVGEGWVEAEEMARKKLLKECGVRSAGTAIVVKTELGWKMIRERAGKSGYETLIWESGENGKRVRMECALAEIVQKGRLAAGAGKKPLAKKFYKSIRAAMKQFEKDAQLPAGIKAEASKTVLNRVMFTLFAQERGIVGNEAKYMQNELARCEKEGKNFHRQVILPLWKIGFDTAPSRKKAAWEEQGGVGIVPAALRKCAYVNGGLFADGGVPAREAIQKANIPNKAYRSLMNTLDEYSWVCDERPARSDKEINPEVLGFVCEALVNENAPGKTGVYYTPEDVTGMISRFAILGVLYDKLGVELQHVAGPNGEMWGAIAENPSAFAPKALQKEDPLPSEHPVETEHRRKRWKNLMKRLEQGEIQSFDAGWTTMLDMEHLLWTSIRDGGGASYSLQHGGRYSQNYGWSTRWWVQGRSHWQR